MTRSNAAVAILTLQLSLCLAARPAMAQYYPPSMSSSAGNIEGFTVAGKGNVSAKPNRLEIDLEVSAASELTADAIVKYRDSKRRLQEAFAALKLENVAVEERGLLINEKGMQANPYFFDYQPNRRTRTEVQLSRKLVVQCSEIRDMDEEALLQLIAKLLDVAQDAGARVGAGPDMNYRYYYNPYEAMQSGLVRFVLDDFEMLEEEAYGKAISDAEARAARLAKLSRVKLGPITAVRVAASPDETTPKPDESTTRKRLESSRFQEIPVRVDLLVRFDVAASSRPEGRAASP